MNILYGVQTTGNSRIVRSQSIIDELLKYGHRVHVLASGCSKKKVVDVEAFHSYERKKGLSFAMENGRLNHLKIACQVNLLRFYKDISTYDAGDYDLVVTDYEPITARIAAKAGIPSIGIGHLYAFDHNVPIACKSRIAKWVIQHFAPVRYPVALHWHHFNQPILPPTLPDSVRSVRAGGGKGPFYLVYLPFENLERVINTLNGLAKYSFRIYANVKTPRIEKNTTILPFSRKGFIDDLSNCVGAICNSGFSFISEALHLGKKVLTKPVKGHIEQESNALALRRLNLGTVVRDITHEAIDAWQATQSPIPLNFADVIPLLCQWISSGSFGDYQELIKQAWQTTGVSEADFQLAVN